MLNIVEFEGGGPHLVTFPYNSTLFLKTTLKIGNVYTFDTCLWGCQRQTCLWGSLLNRIKSFFFFFWMGQLSLGHQLFHSGVLGKYVSRCDPHKEITLEAH